MATTYLLDTGPLGLLAHDRPSHRLPIQTWLVQERTVSVGLGGDKKQKRPRL
jgi:hypothetical protein